MPDDVLLVVEPAELPVLEPVAFEPWPVLPVFGDPASVLGVPSALPVLLLPGVPLVLLPVLLLVLPLVPLVPVVPGVVVPVAGPDVVAGPLVVPADGLVLVDPDWAWLKPNARVAVPAATAVSSQDVEMRVMECSSVG